VAQWLTMHAEVIAIGDELTGGQRPDTNSQWISQRLVEAGIDVQRHATVGDQLEPIVALLREVAARADLAVITGGLGPTADDLTREALAAAAGVQLELDGAVLAHIEALFQRRSRKMPERNRLQAMFPQSSRPIPNPHGTAPGIDLTLTGPGGHSCRFIALPGVPAELYQMWHETVARLLTSGGERPVVQVRNLKCFGAGESEIESRLPDLIQRGRTPTVGITVHAATITLRITATAVTAAACRQQLLQADRTIRDCLGDLVFGEGEVELQDVILQMLSQRGETLATAECGTSGRLSHWLSELPDAAGIYRGGLVAANDTARTILEMARELAKNGAAGCREQFGADYGLAVGPIAADDLESTSPGKYFFALATAAGVTLGTGRTAGHPAIHKDRAAKQALDMLRRHLLGDASHDPHE